ELKKTTRTRTESLKMYEVVYVTCAFAKMELDFRVVFDKEDRVTGLQVRPAQAAKFDPPPYAPAGSAREEKVTVGEQSDWPLRGVRTVPRGKGRFPVVVRVHGSGSQDADEPIGPNKPFRDLAWGLAARGVATLRYAKRPHVHDKKFLEAKLPYTVKEE